MQVWLFISIYMNFMLFKRMQLEVIMYVICTVC